MIPSLLIMLLLTKQNILNQKWLFILWVKNSILAKKSSFDLRNRLGFAFQIKGLRPIMARKKLGSHILYKVRLYGYVYMKVWDAETNLLHWWDRPLSCETYETTSSCLAIPESDYTLRIFLHRSTNILYTLQLRHN